MSNQVGIPAEGETSRLNDACGDVMDSKTENEVRVVFQNVAQIPLYAYQQKNEEIIDFIRRSKLDVLAMAETNLRWNQVRPHDQWEERVRGKVKRSKHIFSYNIHEQGREPRLYGGTGIVLTEQMAARTFQYGVDGSGMGRWSWCKIEGKRHKTVRVVAAYRPCKSTVGDTTVWSQQVRVLSTQGRQDNPHEAWIQDLQELVRRWKGDGESIVVGVDLNEDADQGQTAQALRAVGLKNSVFDHIGEQSRRSTQQRNLTDTPIDAIFVSEGLDLVRAGYAAFGDAIPSDHRAVWIDLSFGQVLGAGVQRVQSSQPRRLVLSNPKVVRKYNDAVLEEYGKHRIHQRATKLLAKAKAQGWELNAAQRREYDGLMTQVNQIRRHAEKRSRKLTMGEVSWSPEVQHARNQVRHWSIEVKHWKGVKTSSSLRKRVRAQAGCDEATSLEEAMAEQTKAYKSYYIVKKEHQRARQEHLVELARLRHDNHEQDYETAIKTLLNRERQREQAGRLRAVFGKGKAMTTKVLFTDEDGVVHECTEQCDIVEACIVENKRRFSQARDTPCMSGRGRQVMDKVWNQDTAADLFSANGSVTTYDNPVWRDLMQALEPVECDVDELTVKEHVKAWKKQTELTNSEPSNPHFGHYKSAVWDETLAEVDMAMREIPYQTGHSPAEWQRVTDVEILKKAQVFNIEKMRTIQLMDAQFNLNNKRLGRQMMATAEERGWLSEFQFGSRKGRSAISAALNKRVSIDIGKQKKVPIWFCSNDAKSCYDRIVPNFAATVMIAAGANPSATRCMFRTLRDAEHRISTAYGVSKRSYSSGIDCCMHGIGQGNGAGPAIWAVISSVMFKAMEKRGHKQTIAYPSSEGSFDILGSAFVDGTDLVVLGRDAMATAENFAEMVHDWSELLRVTGGAIVPEKSAWWSMFPQFENGQWRWKDGTESEGIAIKDGDGERRDVPRRPLEQPLFTLGVFLSFDESEEQQIQVLRKKAEDFAGKMRRSQLSQEDARCALVLRFIKSIEYVMGITQLTAAQWRRIMAPALLAALPQMGCSRTFPRDLVYAPVSLGGLGVPNPVHRQLVQQIQLAFEEVHGDTPTGRMLTCSIQAVKAELGVGGSLFSYPFDRVHQCVTPCWVKGLWRQLHDTGVNVIETTEAPTLQREGDEFLMNRWIRDGKKGAELYHLNMCRMKLGVARMSDIVEASGVSLASEVLEGVSAPTQGSQWANRPADLPSGWWREWRRWCKSLCYRGRLLLTTLGRWYENDGTWQWWRSALTNEIFDSHADPIRVFVPVRQHSRRLKSYRLRGTTPELPDRVNRVVVAVTERGITWDGRIGLEREPDEPAIPYDPVEDLGGDATWDRLLTAARNHTLLLVSDGSFKAARGTSCSIMFDEVTQQHVACNTFVPGPASVHSSYRSELAGVWASLEMLDMIPGLDEGCSVTIALDGLQALRQAQESFVRPSKKDWDILVEIHRLKKRIRANLKWEWVRGHQDDTGKTLSMLERLNVECDKRAKAFWEVTASRRRVRRWKSVTQRWTLEISGEHFSHVGQSEIYKTLQSTATLAYWVKKFGWSMDIAREVDWEGYQGSRAAKKNREVAKFVTKWSSGFVGVGRKMKQMGQQDSAKCNFCGSEETTQHVLRCGEHEAEWSQVTQELFDRMLAIGTAPRLVANMRVGLVRWRRRQEVAGIQKGIGWYPLMLGFFHKDWRRQQAQWMKSHECRYHDDLAWMKEVVRWVWKVPWGVWLARNAKVHDADQHPSLADLRRQVRRLTGGVSQDMTEAEVVLLREGHQMEYAAESQMRQWILDVTAVHARVSARRRARTMQNERQLMSSWLGLTG